MTLERKISDYVTSRFIRERKDSTMQEIAIALDISYSSVRRHIESAKGLIPSREGRTSYSKNMTGMEAGAHYVWVYGHSRETLAKLLADQEDRGEYQPWQESANRSAS